MNDNSARGEGKEQHSSAGQSRPKATPGEIWKICISGTLTMILL
jgi:hypothetical protein